MHFCASKCNEQERSWGLGVVKSVSSLCCHWRLFQSVCSLCVWINTMHSHMPLPYISIYAGCAFMCVRELLLGQFIWTPLFPIILLHIKTSHISHMDYCFNHLNKWPWPLQRGGWDGSACHCIRHDIGLMLQDGLELSVLFALCCFAWWEKYTKLV